MLQYLTLFRQTLSIILIILFFVYESFSQERVYNLDEIVVTAGRTATKLSETTRNIRVIKPEDIISSPVNNIQDLLQYVAGVDVKQRGGEGVQADISIRGGTFEQTLIMIDGIKITDPQTAHHNLNLPISLNEVERIEIVKGDGSSTFGPNAFGGVINIITKKGNEKSAAVQLIGGQNGFYDATLSGSYGLGSLNNHFSFSRKASDGYRHNTNFDAIDFSLGTSFTLKQSTLHLFAGYNDKKFGANSFYSDKFPNQWEHTITKLTSFAGEIKLAEIVFSPKLYWRRNEDDYLLNYLNPPAYHNVHKTNVYGAEVQAAFQTLFGTTAVGAEFNRDLILSSNLGDHSRERKGFFAEQKTSYQNLNATVGFFAYNYANIGWKLWPGINVGYNIIPSLCVYASYGKAFRLPSYTELYYNYFLIPKNGTQKGTPELQYEESTNYESGLHFTGENISASCSIFKRNGSNNIDWGRSVTDSVWHSFNITTTRTTGFEVNTELNTSDISRKVIKRLTIAYTYLDLEGSINRENFRSLYVLNHLRHQLVIGISNALYFDITQSWMFRYEERITGDKNFLVDTQMKRSFSNLDVFVKATNLFNKSYKDFNGVFLPGRWIFAGVKASMQY